MSDHFQCNICGSEQRIAPGSNDRVPGPICTECGSAVRFRIISYILATQVFDGPEILAEHTPNTLKGVGLSDAPPYGRVLAKHPGYVNTFYHREPYLDVMKGPGDYRDLDYMISSDVYEHTPPPAQTPFDTAHAMLKPGGAFLVSVPTAPKYVEHFPDLHDYEQIQVGPEEYVLANATTTGTLQVFKNLRFHGGPGATLEMRIYSVDAVEQSLKKAGFSDIQRLEVDRPEYGIGPIQGLSTVWLARA